MVGGAPAGTQTAMGGPAGTQTAMGGPAGTQTAMYGGAPAGTQTAMGGPAGTQTAMGGPAGTQTAMYGGAPAGAQTAMGGIPRECPFLFPELGNRPNNFSCFWNNWWRHCLVLHGQRWRTNDSNNSSNNINWRQRRRQPHLTLHGKRHHRRQLYSDSRTSKRLLRKQVRQRTGSAQEDEAKHKDVTPPNQDLLSPCSVPTLIILVIKSP